MAIIANYHFINEHLDQIFISSLHIKISNDDMNIFIYTKTIYFTKYKEKTELLNLTFTNKKEAIEYIINNIQKKYTSNINDNFDNIINQINNLNFK